MDKLFFIVFLSFVMGILLMALIRQFLEWTPRREQIYWVVTIGGVVILSFLPIGQNIFNFLISPLITGTVAFTVFYPKFIQWKKRLIEKLEGNSGSPTPKSLSKTPKKSKKIK